MWWFYLIILIIFFVALYVFIQSTRRRAMKRMEEQRAAFVSIISHQLRTPLSVIKGFLEALSTGDQGQLNDGQAEYINEALKINLETIRLVNDYLEVVHMTPEDMPVKQESFDLSVMAGEAVQAMSLLARAHNCEFFYTPSDKIPPVMADRVKVRQVIDNILANAIKYSSGRGRIEVSLTADDGYVTFNCRDNGVGIPADQQSDIFTKFFRAKNVINKDTKGSGLGLYLAKIIITALKGEIWLESKAGAGTTVSFNLPVDKK